MNESKPTPARKATLGAIAIALTFIVLYAATMLPTGRLAAYFLASVFVAGVTCENMPLTAFIAYIGTSALAFMILPDKFALLPYIGFLGWYGVVKYLLERKLKGVVLWAAKFLVFNASAVVLVLVYRQLISILFTFPVQLPLWIVILILEGAFICYDVLYSMVANFYFHSIRSRILQNKK